MSVVIESPSTAVDRTIAILEAVAARSSGMSNAEISRKLDIPKSSASYILRALERHGYLRRDGDNKYRLGLKVLNLGRGALSAVDVREVALPMMRSLVEHVHITSHLAILDGTQAVYVERVEAPGFIKMDTWVGRRMEIYSTSVGKALVSHLPEERVLAILRDRGMKRRTPTTITNPTRFLRELETVREHGYALDDEENNFGVRCVAAPVFNAAAEVEAALNITGTTQQVNKDTLPRIIDLVKETARRLSTQLGYRAARIAAGTRR
ncbi:MAG TPA: IclR family transcriptional regulator [Terriglobales bacterium]|jgi:DNA-binding IclR family transcriptional regulator|nr:IclR family transcriptional regulator [Terriglobales bacterium]